MIRCEECPLKSQKTFLGNYAVGGLADNMSLDHVKYLFIFDKPTGRCRGNFESPEHEMLRRLLAEYLEPCEYAFIYRRKCSGNTDALNCNNMDTFINTKIKGVVEFLPQGTKDVELIYPEDYILINDNSIPYIKMFNALDILIDEDTVLFRHLVYKLQVLFGVISTPSARDIIHNVENVSLYYYKHGLDYIFMQDVGKHTATMYSLDIETCQDDGGDEPDPRGGHIRLLGLFDCDKHIMYQIENPTEEVLAFIVNLSKKSRFLIHNYDFEFRWFYHHTNGEELNCYTDTLLQHHFVEECHQLKTGRRLKTLGQRYLGIHNWEKDLGDHVTTANLVSLSNYLRYDLMVPWYLMQVFNQMDKYPDRLRIHHINSRKVLSLMTYYGMPTEPKFLSRAYMELEKVSQALAKDLDEILDVEFNVASPSQVAEILFDHLGLPEINKRSTSKSVIRELSYMYPDNEVIKLVTQLRTIVKHKSGVVESLYNKWNITTKCIHGEYMQHVVETGRLSSINPNMQNIPVRGPYAPLIRKAFRAPEGYEFMEADYSQIEVFIMSVHANDHKLQEFLNSGKDIYKQTAALFYDKDYDEVTKEERQSTKPIILGTMYMRGAEAIAKEWRLPVEEAVRRQNLFLDEYPNLRDYMNQGADRSKNQDTVSLFGRKRRFPLLIRPYLGKIGRSAVNAPTQGDASDINLSALYRIGAILKDRYSLAVARPLNIIHDSIYLMYQADLRDPVIEITKSIMLNPSIRLPVRLRIEIKVGTNLGEMVEIH